MEVTPVRKIHNFICMYGVLLYGLFANNVIITLTVICILLSLNVIVAYTHSYMLATVYCPNCSYLCSYIAMHTQKIK